MRLIIIPQWIPQRSAGSFQACNIQSWFYGKSDFLRSIPSTATIVEVVVHWKSIPLGFPTSNIHTGVTGSISAHLWWFRVGVSYHSFHVRGHPLSMSAEFSGFWTPSPSCPWLGLISSTKSTQPPLLDLMVCTVAHKVATLSVGKPMKCVV